MLVIISKLVSIFLIVGIGYAAVKAGILKPGAKQVVSDLLVKITCPCIILASTTSQTISKDTWSITLWAIVMSLIIFIVSPYIGYFISRKIYKIEQDDAVIQSFSFGSSNSGFFGFPVSLALFGESILYVFIIENAILGFYLYAFGVIFMEMFSTKKTGKGLDWKQIAKSMTNPCLIASVSAVVLLAAGFHFPAMILDAMDILGASTTPLSMLLVGIMLSECDLVDLLKDKKFVIMSITKMLAVPVLAFLLVNWLPIPVEVKLGTVFCFAFPSAVMILPMVGQEGLDANRAAQCIAFQTLLSMITLPIAAALLGSIYVL